MYALQKFQTSCFIVPIIVKIFIMYPPLEKFLRITLQTNVVRILPKEIVGAVFEIITKN